MLYFRQEGGAFFLYFNAEEEKWVDSIFFFGASILNKLENDNNNYCIDSFSNWYRYNGTELIFSERMEVTCRRIEEECCSAINITSAASRESGVSAGDNNNNTFYQKSARYAQIFLSVRSLRSVNLCLSICPLSLKFFQAFNFHLFGSYL